MNTYLVQEDSPLILIVDDNQSMRMLLRLLLEQEGYQVLEAQDCQAGLATYQQHQLDAILLDVVMPGMDGFTCCTQLQTLLGSEHIPVLMLTALDDLDVIERALEAGASDYITKPVQWTVLRHRLRHLLQESQLYKQLREVNRKLERL